MMAIASALSLEPSETMISSLDTWTDADTAEAQEALRVLRELVEKTRPVHSDRRGFETITALRDTLCGLQRRMRQSIDRSPENEILLQLNDMITEILLEVTELEEVVGENAGVPSLPSMLYKATSPAANGAATPSLVSVMYMLRRGTEEEVLGSVAQILSMCDFQESELFL